MFDAVEYGEKILADDGFLKEVEGKFKEVKEGLSLR